MSDKDPTIKTDAQKLAAELIPAPKKPRPSDEAIAEALKVLQAAEEAEIEGGEFGSGKPGRKKFTVPAIPRHLGFVTMNYTVKQKGKDGKEFEQAREKRYVSGTQHKLTFDEIRDLEFRIDRLIRNEMVGRYGVGVEQRITINVTQERGEGGFAGFGRHRGPESF